MEFNKISTNAKNFKLVLMIVIIAAIGASGIAFSSVNGDEGKLGVGAGISAKGVIGNYSGMEENASSNANVSASISSSSSSQKSGGESQENYQASSSSSSQKSGGESQENYQASSSTEAESHGHYMNSYEKMSADSKDSITIETDHHLYKPGDQVTIEGSIWSNLMTTVGGISSVSIQVTDNNGTSVYDGKGQVNADGSYSAGFQLPSDAKNGAYTVDVKADLSAGVLSTLSLQTQTSLDNSEKFVVVSPNAFAIKAENEDFDVKVASNSTSVSDLKFDEQQKKLSFTVSGQTGTKGVTEVTIPKSLLSGDLTVMIDGQAMAQSDVIKTEDTSDHVTLEINYHHSTHQIDIIGTSAVPEFSSLVPLVLVVSILSVVVLSAKIRRFN